MKKRAEKRPASAKQSVKQSVAGKISSIIFLIFNVILGLFAFLIGIMAIFYGKYLFVLLFIALGIFSFLPKKLIKISNWKKFLICLGAFLVISIMSAALNWDWSSNNNFVNHNMQETFILDTGAQNISMLIYNTTKEESIIINGQQTMTTGYFLVVNCEMTNLGNSPVSINPSYDIIDSQNQTYSGLGSSFAQESLQPNLKKTGYFVFELPDSSQGIKFRIRDDSAIHVVDLGM